MTNSILITGASSGLGEGMAREFARRGYRLALTARRVDKLDVLWPIKLSAMSALAMSPPGRGHWLRELFACFQPGCWHHRANANSTSRASPR
jgi:NAD(P)-dependent dehydrogenase (short-subunit alcohol dehydrogenase family)